MKTLPPRLRLVETRRLKPAPRDNSDFYHSPQWREFVAGLIRLRGRYCEDPDCRSPGRGFHGLIFGDHIKELKDGGAHLDPANVMLRCGPCHNAKTARERAKRAAQRFDGVGV